MKPSVGHPRNPESSAALVIWAWRGPSELRHHHTSGRWLLDRRRSVPCRSGDCMKWSPSIVSYPILLTVHSNWMGPPLFGISPLRCHRRWGSGQSSWGCLPSPPLGGITIKEIWSARVCFLAVLELVLCLLCPPGVGDPEPDATFIRMNGPIQDCGDPNERAPGPPPRDLALPQASLSLDRDTSSLGDKGTRAATFADCLSLLFSSSRKPSFIVFLSLFGGLTE